jgi:4-carboxymuconolactone decarboxylase
MINTDASAQLIPNVPAEAWTPEVQAIFPLMLPPGSTAQGSEFNSILLLANHPRLADPWLRFNVAVARGFVLPTRLKEIAILRVAWRKGSQYEWVQHMLSAAREGLTAEHFHALQQEDAGNIWTTLEKGILQATDEICLSGGILPPTLAALREQFDLEQVMELLFAVGCYIALAAILNTANAALEAGPLAKAEAAGFPMLPNNHPQGADQ